MITRFAIAFAVTISLAFAGAAHAGFQFPLGDGTCNDPNDVLGGLSDPNAVFGANGTKSCHELCKHVVNDCKQYVRDAASCELSLDNDFLFYEKHGCNEFLEGTERKNCIASFTSTVNDDKTQIKEQRDSLLDVCGVWGEICEATCSAP